MRPARFPRRVLFLVTLITATSLAGSAFAQDISINLGPGNGGVTERAIQLIALLTVLSIAPSILIMMTSFTRIVVVLSLLRTAMGTATAPPNTVIIALAMFLTAFVMGPVLQKSYDDGIRPLIAQTIVHLGLDLSEVTTKSSLADAVTVALERTGHQIVRRKTAAE